MITWTLTSADHARSGAGTDTHHAIAEALDAILDLYDQHVAGGCPGPLPVCTVQIGDRDVIIVRGIITADPDRGRDDPRRLPHRSARRPHRGRAGRPALRPERQPVHLSGGT